MKNFIITVTGVLVALSIFAAVTYVVRARGDREAWRGLQRADERVNQFQPFGSKPVMTETTATAATSTQATPQAPTHFKMIQGVSVEGISDFYVHPGGPFPEDIVRAMRVLDQKSSRKSGYQPTATLKLFGETLNDDGSYNIGGYRNGENFYLRMRKLSNTAWYFDDDYGVFPK